MNNGDEIKRMIFDVAVEALENPQSTETKITETLAFLRNNIQVELNLLRATNGSQKIISQYETCLRGVNYWDSVRVRVGIACDFASVRLIIADYIMVVNEFALSEFTITQACMRAIIHVILRKLAELCNENTHCACGKREGSDREHFRKITDSIAKTRGFVDCEDYMEAISKMKF